MVAIRSNFFYTRTVPCELWFLNRDKPEAHRDQQFPLSRMPYTLGHTYLTFSLTLGAQKAKNGKCVDLRLDIVDSYT